MTLKTTVSNAEGISFITEKEKKIVLFCFVVIVVFVVGILL